MWCISSMVLNHAFGKSLVFNSIELLEHCEISEGIHSICHQRQFMGVNSRSPSRHQLGQWLLSATKQLRLLPSGHPGTELSYANVALIPFWTLPWVTSHYAECLEFDNSVLVAVLHYLFFFWGGGEKGGLMQGLVLLWHLHVFIYHRRRYGYLCKGKGKSMILGLK